DKTTLALGDTSVTITYGGKTTSQAVTVAEKELDSITVKTQPRTNYIEGSRFDPTGLVLTLHYNNSNTEDVKYTESNAGDFTFDKDVLALGDSEVTITYGGKSVVQRISVTRGGSQPTGPVITDTLPSIDGLKMPWDEIRDYILKLPLGSSSVIILNGNTSVPSGVIDAINERDTKVKFIVNSESSWLTDGAEITGSVTADLSVNRIYKTVSESLRGVTGIHFSINNTGIPTDMGIALSKAYSGCFANLYKYENGKPAFVGCAKIDQDGNVILPDVTENGEYIVMMYELSDLPGDMNNDGVLNAYDISAILSHVVELETGANPEAGDFDKDGEVTAADAAAVLKKIVSGK
ncbi:MAG: dockerin type I repeat-containing protein, partial [Oscillospiraceae bacterium]